VVDVIGCSPGEGSVQVRAHDATMRRPSDDGIGG
jgi:hypothetical protein